VQRFFQLAHHQYDCMSVRVRGDGTKQADQHASGFLVFLALAAEAFSNLLAFAWGGESLMMRLEKLNPLDKANVVRALMGVSLWEKGEQPAETFDKLRRARNRLAHAKFETKKVYTYSAGNEMFQGTDPIKDHIPAEFPGFLSNFVTHIGGIGHKIDSLKGQSVGQTQMLAIMFLKDLDKLESEFETKP